MKAKERDEKQRIRLQYAVGLSNALKDSKFKSFRDLALNTGFEPAHIQRIAAGKVDVVLTTCVALAEGLGIRYSDLAIYFEKVTDREIKDFLNDQQKRKRKPIVKKTMTKSARKSK